MAISHLPVEDVFTFLGIIWDSISILAKPGVFSFSPIWEGGFGQRFGQIKALNLICSPTKNRTGITTSPVGHHMNRLCVLDEANNLSFHILDDMFLLRHDYRNNCRNNQSCHLLDWHCKKHILLAYHHHKKWERWANHLSTRGYLDGSFISFKSCSATRNSLWQLKAWQWT